MKISAAVVGAGMTARSTFEALRKQSGGLFLASTVAAMPRGAKPGTRSGRGEAENLTCPTHSVYSDDYRFLHRSRHSSPIHKGRGSPAEISATGRSADRAGRRDWGSEHRRAVMPAPTTSPDENHLRATKKPPCGGVQRNPYSVVKNGRKTLHNIIIITQKSLSRKI